MQLQCWSLGAAHLCHFLPETWLDFIVAVLLAVNYTCSVRIQPLSGCYSHAIHDDDNPARCGLCTQGDDEKASRKNFTDCPIKDYRPMIKSLITEPPYLDILVYSGDVDAQIPHTATEAWTSQLGVPLKAGGEWRPWSQPDDSGDPAVLGCTLLLFAQLLAGCTLCTLEF